MQTKIGPYFDKTYKLVLLLFGRLSGKSNDRLTGCQFRFPIFGLSAIYIDKQKVKK